LPTTSPTTGPLAIASTARLENVEVYDAFGRRVRQTTTDLTRVDMTGLPAGHYTLKLTLAEGKFDVRKMVKR